MLEAKAQLARKRRILNPGCAAYFNEMTRRASGRIRWLPGGWLAGLGPFNFRVARDPSDTDRADLCYGDTSSVVTIHIQRFSLSGFEPGLVPRDYQWASSSATGETRI